MIKQIVKQQTILATSAVASYETRLDLGVEVKKILGYYIQILKTGGLTPEQCTVSFANSSKTIFEPVGLGHLIVSSSVAIKDRFFREEPFPVDGYLQARVAIPAVPGTDFVIQYILLVDTAH